MLNNVTYIVLSVVHLNAVMAFVVAPYFTFKMGTFRLRKMGMIIIIIPAVYSENLR